MNLAEALEIALPPPPLQRVRLLRPRVEDNVLAREEVEGGVRTVLVMRAGSDGFYRLTPHQWQLLRLFDGKRSLAEIAGEFEKSTASRCTEDEVRDFADFLADTDLLYKPPAEKITALAENLRRDRRHARKSRFGDLSEVSVFSFDPDALLTAIYPYLRFIYTRGYALFNVALFSWMTFVFVSYSSEILHDTATYYTFSQKGLADLAEFWVLLMFIGMIHETAHGLTCKHYGGGVHRMGFLLMYSLPCFFCDTSEAWVYTGRFGRILTMIAGIWVELTICAFATIAWWATAPGTWFHDMAYKVILFTGIAVVVLNINPLVKLDGYFIFCELVGVGDLKEKSTAYTSSWVRNRVFGLPVELEYLPPRRRPLYIGYAVASGLYSYVLLFVVIGFSYNVLAKFTPDWAFLPALAVALLLFKSRLRLLEKFMRTVYLDKKDRLRSLLWRPWAAIGAAVLLLLLVTPLWPTFVQGRFELQAHNRAVMRNQVAGSVAAVFVSEGQQVSAGTPLLRLRNLALQSQAAQAQADFSAAQAQTVLSQLHYSGLGPAEQRRQQLAERNGLIEAELTKLEIQSPIAGTVTTARLRDLVGSYLPAGTHVLEIADFSTLEARVYLPQYEIRDLRPNARVDLHLDSLLRGTAGTLLALAPISSQPAPGLLPQQQTFEGLQPPPYYVAWVKVTNTGGLRENMLGTAKIFVRRESIVQALWRASRDAVQRKLW